MSWQQGYAPPNSDRREGVLRRKRLDYLDCVAQYYDIQDIERTDEEINMLRQVFWMQLGYLFDFCTPYAHLPMSSVYNYCFACAVRLLLIALEQCLMFLFSNKHKFRNPWSAYFTYGKLFLFLCIH